MKRYIKHLSVAIVSFVLIAVTAFQLPIQAAAAEDAPDYICEVKVFTAKEEKDAKSALENEGYQFLDCNLNQGAEGGVMSKGKKAVYLGYKTTKDRSEAITDLAVMNMKGGYKTQDYESMMNDYLSCQIIPFVEGFIAAVREYRENYTSDNEANQKRAQAIHDMLNRFTDDDTGKHLGNLLLNETKYEMGDDAYDALSDDEKKEHADIVTIIAQANGQATLAIENLITRGSDDNDDTWLERFSQTTYDDLVEMTGETPTDARQTLAKLYDDDANTITGDHWKAFQEVLTSYDEAAEYVESYDADAYQAAVDAYCQMDENTSEEEQKKINDTLAEEMDKYYIVEESDIIGYNKKGEKIVVKNQTAYYKLAETNRDEDAEFYSTLGTGNDLNGDVGREWLSLYYVKNEKAAPILADSLKAVVDSTDIPAGYETGIHKFGEDTAFNLNNSQYVWDDDAKSVIVYFNTDTGAVSTADLAA